MANRATSKKKRSTAPISAATGPQPAAAPEAPHIQPPRAHRRAEMVKNQRAERQKRYKKQQRDWMLTKIGAGIVAVALLVGLGYATYNYVEDRQNNVKPEGVEEFSYSGSNHSEDPQTYTETPPVGGVHSGTVQNCAYYDLPIGSEHAVHSMEHGAVWITYRPDLPQDQIDNLRERAEEQTYILVSPYPDLPSPIVASAWNNQLRLDSVEDERLDQFIRYFRQGPQAPEPGAPCTGGTSATQA